MIRLILFFFCILISDEAIGQKSATIYFKSGSYKISEAEQQKLDVFLENNEFSPFDTLVLNGYADSIGNMKANYSLSYKRVHSALTYLKKRIVEDQLIIIDNYKGEKRKTVESKDRRVDVILRPLKADILQDTSNNFTQLLRPKANSCYYVDYYLLGICRKATILKGKKQFVMLELTEKPFNKVYGGRLDKNGNFEAYPIRWSSRISGENEWRKMRYQAIVPLEDFEKYKIFTVEPNTEACKTCHQDFAHGAYAVSSEKRVLMDEMLSANIQQRHVRGNRYLTELRIPVEYVDTNAVYTLTGGYDTIRWKQKSGAEHSKFYYSRIPWNTYNNRGGIEIYREVDYCNNKFNYPPRKYINEDSLYYRLGRICGGNYSYMWLLYWSLCSNMHEYNWAMKLEVGGIYQQSVLRPYAGLSIAKNPTWKYHGPRTSLLLGVDEYLRFYGAFRLRKTFGLGYPLRSLTPFHRWDFGAKYSRFEYYPYISAETRKGVNHKNRSYFDQSLNIGLILLQGEWAQRHVFIHLQYGLAYDFLQNNSTKPYQVMQAGLTWGINQLGRRKYIDYYKLMQSRY